jgi:hypothetical protein
MSLNTRLVGLGIKLHPIKPGKGRIMKDFRSARLTEQALKSVADARSRATASGKTTYGPDDWMEVFIDDPSAAWNSFFSTEVERIAVEEALKSRCKVVQPGPSPAGKLIPENNVLTSAINLAIHGTAGSANRNHLLYWIIGGDLGVDDDSVVVRWFKVAGVDHILRPLKVHVKRCIDAGIGAE